MSTSLKSNILKYIHDPKSVDIKSIIHTDEEHIMFATEWIRWKRNVTFPIELDFDEKIPNEEGYTIAQWIITILKKDPPPYYQHDPKIANFDGNTAMMLWIIHVKTMPPPWTIHDNTVTNTKGLSALSLWYQYVLTDPPEPILDIAKLKNKPSPPPTNLSNYFKIPLKKQLKAFLFQNNCIHAKVAYELYSKWCDDYRQDKLCEELFHLFIRKLVTVSVNEYGFIKYNYDRSQ